MWRCTPSGTKARDVGHTVKLMAPQFVKPYVKSNKNDAADAETICEAVGRVSMRFVPIKNLEQQSVLALPRVRQGFVKAPTARGQPDPWTAQQLVILCDQDYVDECH